jgi:citrate synthase
MSETPYEYSPGLQGVPCARSSVCYLDGSVGKLQYRGYPIEALAENCSFEEVSFLLLEGRLPTRSELDAFTKDLASKRSAPEGLFAAMKTFPKDGHPMAALASVVAAFAMHEKADATKDAASRKAASHRLIAVLPTFVAAWDRIRKGHEPIAPKADLSHAANFLYMLSGETPDEIVVKTMDVALVLHAEHQMNASTFTARVVGSSLASPYAVVSAAIETLSGPLHGGANEEVLKMLATLPSVDAAQVRAWAEDRLANKAKISGFGHREYKVKDPRANLLQSLASQVFVKFGATPIYDIAMELERQMADLVGKKGVYPNVDFYSGIVYQKMGIETDLFTPLFAIARVSGWLAHWNEQLEDNRIFRPNQIWTGEADRTLTPIASRG